MFFLWILDYLKEDGLLQEYINENEKIIEKYHRKINEMFQLIKENTDKDIQWSPVALDYKQKEDEEKKLCDEKKRKLIENPTDHENIASDDKGVFL